MTIKYQAVTLDHSDPSVLMNEIRDFLVTSCGWTDNTPAGQDDDFNYGLGYFLESDGEDGNSKLHMHVWANHDDDGYEPPKMSYLSAAITTTGQMTCDVPDGSLFPTTGPFWIRVEDELMVCSGTSGSTITITQRGAGGTTPATHAINSSVGRTDDAFCDIEMYMHQDISSSAGIAASSSSAVHTRTTVPTVAGLTGYGADRFAFQSFLRITSGSESGKMRPITAYADAGTFTYRPFLTAPGDNDCEVVAAGFFPACSKRQCDFAISDMLWGFVPRNTVGSATTYFMYGSKDGLLLVSKYDGEYKTTYFGNVVPYASKLFTSLTSGAAAAATAIVVANRHLFVEGEKYRILSTDTDDWADNEDRSAQSPAGNWDDLDPEEISSEEIVVDSIVAGAGDAGTINLTTPLLYSYRTGANVGEDPRPAIRSVRLSAVYYDLMDNGPANTNGSVLPVYAPTSKANISVDATHRQVIRAYHEQSAPWNPRSIYLTDFLVHVNRQLGSDGEWNVAANPADSPSVQSDRYVGGLMSVFVPFSASFDQYGRWQYVKGTIPHLWWFNYTAPPYGGTEEDTLKAWWGSQFETFRLFSSPATTPRWFTCGPEIA